VCLSATRRHLDVLYCRKVYFKNCKTKKNLCTLFCLAYVSKLIPNHFLASRFQLLVPANKRYKKLQRSNINSKLNILLIVASTHLSTSTIASELSLLQS
jgi:hypothetical protein